MDFQITGLSKGDFTHLFALGDEELRRHDARRVVADAPHAFPCRVSLVDAEPGDEVILAHYEHLPANSPFRSSHAVYVRRDASEWRPRVGEVPDQLRRRMLSLRGFDREDMMRTADLIDGRAVERLIETMLADPDIAYVHAHYAKQGCFAARIDRVAP
jgi:Protein of unknown function (DUF1203)